jgi:tRNA-dihydrouridine synthase A
MVTAPALIYGDMKNLLAFHAIEKPLALQLGGSDAHAMARCAKIAQDHDFDEVNLNVGCPSDRVQSGEFGACLMLKPQVVADCISAMLDAVQIPVTVKTRIGVDDMQGYRPLADFAGCIAEAGCKTFIVHARKAWLQGLSPKENREKPPLHYEYVYRLKQEFPHLNIVINGGIKKSVDVIEHLRYVDGTMVGREAYQNPYALIDVHKTIFKQSTVMPTPAELVERYLPYIEEQLEQGVQLKHMVRHMLGLFQGMPGARHWRRYLSEHAVQAGADISVVVEALRKMKAWQDRNTGVVVNES